jgi:DNA modification methylase
MDGASADMVFTDPPYNVDYEGGNGLKIQNDKMENDAFYQFLFEAYKNMINHTKEGGGIYVCHADSEGLNFRKAMIDAGWLLKQCLVWVKNSLVMGRQDYHWRHEPILYGWKPGAAHNWFGDRKQTTVKEVPRDISISKQEDGKYLITFLDGLRDISFKVDNYEIIEPGDDTVWRIDKPKKNDVHPTMKPIELCANAIRNSSARGQIVLDLFGGSGSTLITSEQLKRRCYMMEFDSVYSDVIVERYIELKEGDSDVFLLRDGKQYHYSDLI